MSKKAFSVNHGRPLVRRNEIGMRKRLRVSFKQMAKKLAQEVLAKYGDMYKADKPLMPDSVVGSIVSMLDQEDFDKIGELSKPYIVGVTTGGAHAASTAIAALGFPVDDLIASKNAKLWGKNRAAEMVGRKWVDGNLVTNPNAKWAINESTRDMIRLEVERALREGSTVKELADAIRSSSAFSEERAMMVSRTEMAIADTRGTLEAFKACAEITGKRWSTAGDDRVSDECNGNEDEGDLLLDQNFSSGDDAPPAHPNCRCAILPVFANEMN